MYWGPSLITTHLDPSATTMPGNRKRIWALTVCGSSLRGTLIQWKELAGLAPYHCPPAFILHLYFKAPAPFLFFSSASQAPPHISTLFVFSCPQ